VIFGRAIERGNLVIAETTAREIGNISLVEALELTALIARKDPRRHGRAATHWRASTSSTPPAPVSTMPRSSAHSRRSADHTTKQP
jgi:hypothetical protein